VDVIHTDSSTFGLSDQIGHKDFYPNGGSSQAGYLRNNNSFYLINTK
jgi:hypothetical protein